MPRCCVAEHTSPASTEVADSCSGTLPDLTCHAAHGDWYIPEEGHRKRLKGVRSGPNDPNVVHSKVARVAALRLGTEAEILRAGAVCLMCCAVHAAATGIGIAPRIFNTGPLGAGIIAEAVNIQPALLYIAQSAAPNIAIGASIVSVLPRSHFMRHLCCQRQNLQHCARHPQH